MSLTTVSICKRYADARIAEAIAGAGGGGVVLEVLYDQTTGYTEAGAEATVASPATILRVDEGAELCSDWAIAEDDAPRILYVEAFGGIAQPVGGDGSFTHYWPVVTLSESGAVEGAHTSVLLDGPQKVQQVSGLWAFEIPAGESGTVRFKWGSRFASLGPAVDPTSGDYPCRFQVRGQLVAA
jgi:hypothetical protein